MDKICTSLEQSKKLVELGIDENTADMCWSMDMPDLPTLLAYPITDCDNWEYKIPAWSFTALIELMPDKISINNESYYLSFTKKSVEFRGPITWDGQKTKSFEMDNILDAAFEMVVWLKKNNKI